MCPSGGVNRLIKRTRNALQRPVASAMMRPVRGRPGASRHLCVVCRSISARGTEPMANEATDQDTPGRAGIRRRAWIVALLAGSLTIFIVTYTELVTQRIMIGFLQLPPVVIALLFLNSRSATFEQTSAMSAPENLSVISASFR